jgi:hypothetical protein
MSHTTYTPYAQASYSTATATATATASPYVHFEIEDEDEDMDMEESYRPPTPYETPADPIDEYGQPCPSEIQEIQEPHETHEPLASTLASIDASDELPMVAPLASIDASDEMALEELQQHSEVRQLELLIYESEHLQEHGVQPSFEWFEARFLKIYQYSELNWADLALRYQFDNADLARQASEIQRAPQYLIDEWSVGPVFDLEVYDGVLHAIQTLWTYYDAEYVDESGDIDVSDLISDMKHL